MERMAVVVVAACLCVGLSMGFTSPAMCPDMTELRPSMHAGKKNVALKFSNRAGIDVHLLWVNFDGEEVKLDDIAAAGTLNARSAPGHAFSVRSALGDGLLLSTFVTPMADSAKFHIEPCLDAPLNLGTRSLSGLTMRQQLSFDAIVSSVSGAGMRRQLSSNASGSQESQNSPWGLLSKDHIHITKLQEAFPQCDLQDLGQVAVPGFYVLCMQRSKKDGGALDVGVAVSLNDAVTLFTIREEALQIPELLRTTIRHGVGFRKRKAFSHGTETFRPPPFALFTTDGRYRIVHPRDMLPGSPYNKRGTAYLFEGGNFVWPGVKPGHTRVVSDVVGSVTDVTLTTLSLKPLILEVKGVLSDEDCDHIIETAQQDMIQSIVAKRDTDKEQRTASRTSVQRFLQRGQTEVLKNIERRVRDFTRVPLTHGEDAQVLRYYAGQHYHAHHDYFDPAIYLKDEFTQSLTEYGAKNRLATVFWYLSDVPDGGATNFPRADGMEGFGYDTYNCTTGISVQPVKGKMIIFYNMLPSGGFDDYSLHAGCDVGEGHVKWAANKWIWNKPVTHLGVRWNGDPSDQDRDLMKIPSPDTARSEL